MILCRRYRAPEAPEKNARRRRGRLAVRAALACLLAVAWTPALAQPAEPSRGGEAEAEDSPAIIILGTRGSAVTDIAPVAELDADAIAATGASTMDELQEAIRGQTQSADGSDPIFLLNAQRVSGYRDIRSLPPEAIDKVEVLPEQVALRFGYPPTRRVVNFITKRHFRQVEVKASAGATTEWGSATQQANLGLTRLRGDGRLTANLEYRRTDPLFQSDRSILPDPGVPFDPIGNVTAPDGGEIDPALSAAAGQPVTIAPVPDSPADRTSLAAYADRANRPRLFGLGPYATLTPRNDTVKGEAVIADRLGETVAGSLSLSAEQSRDRTVAGPAAARLWVPETSPFTPFAGPVVLNRYLTGIDPLRQREKTTTLGAGATLRGAVAGWQWDVTASFDQKQVDGRAEQGIDLAAANAAIADGADPFAPLDPALLALRQVDVTCQRTRSMEAKAVATNKPVRLPAGQVTVTASAEVGRSTADSSSRGANPFALHLGRGRAEGSLSLDIPLTSRRDQVVAALGELSVNASASLRTVSGFGSLHDTIWGFAWAPIEGVQFLGTMKRSAAAPDMAQQSNPVREIPNVPVFDFGTGRTEIVTLIQGGNPDLLAERRLVRSLTLNVSPLEKGRLRLGATYETSEIRDQTGTIYAITPQTEAIFPELFTRDSAGRLVTVAYRPVNFELERKRSLQLTLSSSGSLGKAPPEAEGGEAKPPPRPHYYAGIGADIRLTDRLLLRPGAPELDLLGGDSIGTWTPGAVGWAYGGINYRGFGATFNAWYGGPRRISSEDPAADLRYAPMFKLKLGAYMPLKRIFADQDWAEKMQLRFDVDNVTDARQQVRDRNGDTPFRYQAGLTDPIGRTATVTLRKLF